MTKHTLLFTALLFGTALTAGAQRQVRNHVSPMGVQAQFGRVVPSIGDVDADGQDDYAISGPGVTIGGNGAGDVRAFSGATGALLWSAQGTGSWIPCGSSGGTTGDFFGFAMALVPDADGDGRDDLAVGAPGVDFFVGTTDAGVVYTLEGTSGGLGTTVGISLAANFDSLPGTPDANGRFGIALASGDFDGDGRDDVVLNSTTTPVLTTLLGSDAPAPTFRSDLAHLVVTTDLGAEPADVANQLANPVGSDFDGDGDVDLLVLVEGSRHAVLKLGAAIDEPLFQPDIQTVHWFLHPVESVCSLDVVLPPMPDGSSPDSIEFVLTTSHPSGPPGAPEVHRVQSEFTLAEGEDPGDTVNLWVPFAGEPGVSTSVAVRCFRLDEQGISIVAFGVESVVHFDYDPAGTGMQQSAGGTHSPSMYRSRRRGDPPAPPPHPHAN